ncbi:hypothetical protein T265_06773 [Opisthorchis viverrini]|uniref:Glypican n=1 Tax=Opisthorchis viverrini TaxID=6198 RepID=A0A074ZEY7_OPIVI|nr:hypothetical protein T265_06773 [Opisthorchis viverrini]KER25861.1 hypothetical protein T265_06773 [Opisthorchis viverrini]
MHPSYGLQCIAPFPIPSFSRPLRVLYLRISLSAPASNVQLPILSPQIIDERDRGSYNNCAISAQLLQLIIVIDSLLVSEPLALKIKPFVTSKIRNCFSLPKRCKVPIVLMEFHSLQFFVSALSTTMATLHSNFKRSYGYNYELNQDFFFQFFDGLAKYMLGQKQNLSLMIDMFFRELLIRIVRLMLLAKSESDLRTADCVAEGLEKQNPFDQTPEIIKALMGRAFPPARIAANALLLGNEMIGSIMNHTSLRVACVRHWLELRYCSLCSATVNAYICPHSCRLAFDSCLSNVRPLALKWASFIDRLLPVLGALQGPTSFPQVNRPIQMHITDAIMNLQRVFSRMDQMLLTNCSHYGIALSNRLRRSTPFRYPTSQAPPRTDFGQPLHQIEALGDWSRKAVEKYSKFRNLLTDLPARFCTDDFLRTRRPFRASTQPCWNGEHLVDGSSFRIETEPELLPSISSTGQDASTDTLYHELQRMSEKLDAITRYHADPDYLPVDNSYVSRYSDTVASWRDTPEFATTLERGKLAVSSNVVPEFLGSEGERRGMLNMTAPFELSRPSDGSVGDRQNPIPVHEGGSGSLPSIHQNNIWTLGREPENDGYLLLSQHASDSVVRDPVSPSERHSDFASPLGSRLDDEDTVMQSYNESPVYLRYADDTVPTFEDEGEAQALLNKLTIIIPFSACALHLHSAESFFRTLAYLGSRISSGRSVSHEVSARISKAGAIFASLVASKAYNHWFSRFACTRLQQGLYCMYCTAARHGHYRQMIWGFSRLLTTDASEALWVPGGVNGFSRSEFGNTSFVETGVVPHISFKMVQTKQTPFDLVTEVRENQSNSSRGLPGHRSAVVSSTQIRKIHAHQHHDPPDQIWIPAKAVQTLDMHSGVPHSRHFFNSNWYFFFSILLFSL